MEDSQPSPSSNLVHAENSTTNIPLDLTIEILARLPGNSIIRFQIRVKALVLNHPQ
ncbi:predicted protein [Arabidopsis lyrata subsp. lyrata]|uniref:Predicted protein n=1 Tax=Arabidopsis lyrata subsp. lyrata TaxID=81972 RepID=D7M1I6_ARALL|nr:predicted protein [Arabidopsis lyrata subsp. lyrata]